MPTIRIRKDRTFTLPAGFCKKYDVRTGDNFEVVEIGNGLLFKPIRQPRVDKSEVNVRKEARKTKPKTS